MTPILTSLKRYLRRKRRQARLSLRYCQWPNPSNKTLWALMIVIGLTVTLVVGFSVKVLQLQLNAVEAHQQLVLQELKELKRHVRDY